MERILAWYRVTSSLGAVVALVVANAVPLMGVLFFGWNVWTILIVYWLENGIVGVVNIAKIAKAEAPATSAQGRLRMNGRPVGNESKAALIPFFVMHYGIFWVVHGVFVFTLPAFGAMSGGSTADLTAGFDPGTILLALVALGISHGCSYYWNFVRGGEYRRVSAAGQMFSPYGRLVVLHITIILGGIAISTTGAPVAAVAILVVLKTILDLGFHLAEHRKAGAGHDQPPVGAVIEG